MSQPTPPPRPDEEPVEISWFTELAPPVTTTPPPPGSPHRGRTLLVAVLALVSASVIITVAVVQLTGSDGQAGPARSGPSEPAATTTDLAGPATGDPDPTESPAATDPVKSPKPEPTQPAPTRPPKLTDKPSRDGVDARVIRPDGSDACTPLYRPAAYGAYPAARCTFFETATGRMTGERIEGGVTKRARTVACQRNLKIANPTFNPGQTNTWWVWTRSDQGTYDWFPETAIVQGASKRPLVDVAVCR